LLYWTVQEINQNLHADRSTLFLVNPQRNEIWSKVLLGDESLEIRLPIGKGIAGLVAKTGQVINIADAYQDNRFNPEVDRQTGYHTRSILAVPIRDKSRNIIGVIQCLNKKNGKFTATDEQFLAAFAEHIAIAIQNARLYQEALERKRLEDEMMLAAEIQRRLLPKHIPNLPGYDIFAYHHPSRSVGGDYFDFFVRDPLVYFTLADVSGKGVPAALLMANLQATFHVLVHKPYSMPELVAKINQHLVAHTDEDKYATLVYGCIDTTNHLLTYVNAGHVPPYIYHWNPSLPTIEELGDGGIPVGMLPDMVYKQGETHFEPGDLLLVCSDGITEAVDKQDSFFGLKRLYQFLESHAHLSAHEFGQNLLQEIQHFCGGQIGQDDLTLIVIKRKAY